MPDSSSKSAHATPRTSQHTTALTIGNFDGVHIGHQLIVQRARHHAGPSGRVIVMSFHPHVMTTLNPRFAPPQLDPFSVRKQRLLDAGADEVIELVPTPELLSMDPESFLDKVIVDHDPNTIVEGHDFHFGKRRSGTPDLLKHLCTTRGIETDILGPVKVTLTDQTVVTASSSLIRWLLDHSRVRDAAYVLGRPHELTGTVVQGQQLGRTISIPTINLETHSHLPADGVYSGCAVFNNQRILAAINIGSRPTVQGTQRRAEAHLLNSDATPWTPAPDMPEYGWDCTLQLIGWIRDEIRFDGLESLQRQIRRDCDRICSVSN